jgi:hypothetical protein
MPLSRNPNEYNGPKDVGYVSVYYPGVTDPPDATEVEVLPGTQLSAIDVTLAQTRTYTVRGRVVVTVSLPGSTRPFVSIRPRQPLGAVVTSSSSSFMNADGTFEIRNVVPGSYTIQASAGTNPATALRTERSIEVNGDTDGVVITIGAGFDVPFHIVFDQPPASGANDPFSNIRPLLMTVANGSPTSGFVGTLLNPPTIQSDGTFAISNVTPGVYQIRLSGLPSPDHYIKAVNFGQADALDGFAIDHTPDTPIEVLVGSNAGKMEGNVMDREGKPVQAAQWTLIPADRSKSDRYRTNFTDSNGHFSIRGIFPGEYRVFAWDVIEPNAYRDPEFLRAYESQGKTVSIGEGSNPNVELRPIKINP